jgi:hypothetical protein
MQVETTIKPIGASYILEFVEFLFELRGKKIFKFVLKWFEHLLHIYGVIRNLLD